MASLTLLLPLLPLPIVYLLGGGGGGGPQQTVTYDEMGQLYPGPLGNGAFSKVIPGHFTGRLLPDAIVMDGSNPTLLVSPEAYRTSIKAKNLGANIVANDFTSIPDPMSTKDLLVSVGAAGLLISARDDTAETWVARATTLNQPPWLNAELVCSGNLDSASPLFVAGAGSSLSTLIIEQLISGAFAQSTITTTAGIYALHTIDWNGDAADDIAVFHSTGATIYETTGAVLTTLSWTGPPMIPAVVSVHGSAKQRIAAILNIGLADEYFGVISDDSGFEGPYNIGTPGIISLNSADYDGDGDSDLFMSVTSAAEYQMVINESVQTVTSTFDIAGTVSESYGPSARDPLASNVGLAIADFDNDGDMDVLAPVSETVGLPKTVRGTFKIVRQGPVSYGPITVDHRNFLPNVIAYRIPLAPLGVPLNEITLFLDATKVVSEIETLPGETPELMFLVRHTTTFGQSEEILIDSDFVALDAERVNLILPGEFAFVGSDDIVSITIRQVAFDSGQSGDPIVNVGPSATFTYASRDQVDDIPVIWPEDTLPSLNALENAIDPTNPLEGEASCDFDLPPTDDERTPTEPLERG